MEETNDIKPINSIFCAFLVTITGLDLLSFNVASSNIRLSYILFFIAFLYFRKDACIVIKSQKIIRSLLFLFIVFSLPSIFVSSSIVKSLLYPLWISLNYLLIFTVFSLLSSKVSSRQELFNGVIISFRAQILVSLFSYIFNIGVISGRVSLLYYEPSYFAFALVLYMATIVHRFKDKHSYWLVLDSLLIFVAFLTTQSFNLVLGLLLCSVFSIFIGRSSSKQIKSILLFICGISFLLLIIYIYIQNVDDLISTRLKLVLESDNIVDYLTGTGGNRIPRKECAWAVFLEHKLFGVGIGAYDSYTYNTNIAECTVFLGSEDSTPIGKPATNIYVEILSTVGVFGAWPIFLFFLYILTRKKIDKLDIIQASYFNATVSLLILLMFEANYMRLYLWMILGLYYGSTSITMSSKKNRLDTIENQELSRLRSNFH